LSSATFPFLPSIYNSAVTTYKTKGCPVQGEHMADKVRASTRAKWHKRLLGLIGIASVLGPSTTVARNDVELSRTSLEARVLAVREALRHNDTNSVGNTVGDKLAQWMNWPNWGNWGNWPNWNNWNNWGNWWNR
jgi:hypothetical protein